MPFVTYLNLLNLKYITIWRIGYKWALIGSVSYKLPELFHLTLANSNEVSNKSSVFWA